MAALDGTETSSTVLVAVGDLHPGKEESPEPLFDHVLDLIRGADIAFGQVEVVFTDKGDLQRFPSATPYIRVPPGHAASLAFAGFDVVSCASNHAMDWGADALLDSIRNVSATGVQVVGAGTNEVSARQPATFEHNGNRLALLAYTSVAPPGCYAIGDEPGVAPMRAKTYYETIDYQAGTPPRVVTIPDANDLSQMEDDIRIAKAEGNTVVLSLHWGVHHLAKVVADYQPIVAHAAIDAGADLVIGHHPHLLKAVEVYRGKVIFYSIGNFAFDGTRHRTVPDAKRHERLRHYQQLRSYGGQEAPVAAPGVPPPRHAPDSTKTVIVKAIVRDGIVNAVSFLPTLINELSQPVPLRSGDPRFDEVLRYMGWVSSEFPHRFIVRDDEVLVDPSE